MIRTGKRRASDHFVVVLARRTTRIARRRPGGDLEGGLVDRRIRLGVTVSKRVGNAVVRNHLKRLIREWFRIERNALPDGTDLVVIARGAAHGMSGREASLLLNRTISDLRAGSNCAQAVRT